MVRRLFYGVVFFFVGAILSCNMSLDCCVPGGGNKNLDNGKVSNGGSLGEEKFGGKESQEEVRETELTVRVTIRKSDLDESPMVSRLFLEKNKDVIVRIYVDGVVVEKEKFLKTYGKKGETSVIKILLKGQFEDMSSMFYGCSNLCKIDLGEVNTENVTNMSNAFYGCSGLTNLDLSKFNTENVTDMSNAFYGCSGLTNLDLSNFNTKNVTDMSNAFYGCSSLTKLDLSSFDTKKVTNMGHMFCGCSSLTNLDLSNFNTKKVTDMRSMFRGCSSLTKLDLSSFDTKKVTNMGRMFSECSNLTYLDLSSFNIKRGIVTRGLLFECVNVVKRMKSTAGVWPFLKIVYV